MEFDAPKNGLSDALETTQWILLGSFRNVGKVLSEPKRDLSMNYIVKTENFFRRKHNPETFDHKCCENISIQGLKDTADAIQATIDSYSTTRSTFARLKSDFHMSHTDNSKISSKN